MTAERLLPELAAPACFPHAPAAVQLVQTHLSVVCLAGELVYKLKKAMTLPFVDFAPLAARRQACRDEVRLNGRACPGVYLGTAALRRDAGGALRFAALGDDDGPHDLDVAVVMRRLPAERMLDVLVHDGRVTVTEIEALAQQVARFHDAAVHDASTAAIGDPDRLQRFATANFTELRTIAGHGLPTSLLDALERRSAAAFASLLPTLRQRAARGLVVDGHGDLHTRNVCMTTPPVLYDCIEFEPAFRIGDVATEVAFLVMDLRYRRAPGLARAFANAYAAARGDGELLTLLPTLCSYRAMVRAKVAALAAAEPELGQADRDGARGSAHQHLQLAAAFLLEAPPPRWLVILGPPASGKSSLAAALHAATGWPHHNSDVVRKRLAGLLPTAPARPEHYTTAFSDRTYDHLCTDAAASTRGGEAVVLLDGHFAEAARREAAVRAAVAAGARPTFVWLDVDTSTAAARAAARVAAPGNVSDAGPSITARRHTSFVPPTAAEGPSLLRLDGRRPTATLLVELLAQLLTEPC
ncbi:MAG: AAA family ATPase [Planctomycetes bacterium]|nr:AAA family ATPase [Planctomycetota bacterium]